MIRVTREEQLGRELFSGKYQGFIGFMALFVPIPFKFSVLAALSDQVVAIQAKWHMGENRGEVASVAL